MKQKCFPVILFFSLNSLFKTIFSKTISTFVLSALLVIEYYISIVSDVIAPDYLVALAPAVR